MMGLPELYKSTYINWVNCNAWFTYLLMGTLSYMSPPPSSKNCHIFPCNGSTAFNRLFTKPPNWTDINDVTLEKFFQRSKIILKLGNKETYLNYPI